MVHFFFATARNAKCNGQILFTSEYPIKNEVGSFKKFQEVLAGGSRSYHKIYHKIMMQRKVQNQKKKKNAGRLFQAMLCVTFGVWISTLRQLGQKEPVALSSPPVVVVPNQCHSPSRGHFDSIYAAGGWSQSIKTPSDFYGDATWPPPEIRRRSASGKGSYLGYATETSLQIIKDTITKYNIKSMVDTSCGDANWILDSWETDSLPLYVGLDVTSAVIELNKLRFAHHSNKQFHFWDATACIIPKFQNGTKKQSFDLVHVRDVIQHLHIEQGVKYFCNVFKSSPRVLITTNFAEGNKNSDLSTEGSFYKNNLLLPPFSFPKVDTCTPTHPKIEGDVTCVWDLTEPWVKDFIATKC